MTSDNGFLAKTAADPTDPTARLVDADGLLDGSPYISYTYSYPHKTAYRPLPSPVLLKDLWATEDRQSLFLYLHIPFCEYRCGFCNLFTQSNPAADLPRRYLDQLSVEAQRVREALGEAEFARLAVGGGTPTFLDCGELEALFQVVVRTMGARPGHIPVSLEASPATVTPEKLALLREFGVDRLSIGVQTFADRESGRLGRPQKRCETERALDMIAEAQFPTLNIDLIYGGEGQTVASFLNSVRTALTWRPEELYLYPLYVRPLTGLGRRDHSWDDQRLACYRAARDMLLEAGYRQVSLRMFRGAHAPDEHGPVYCCQSDGMVGLGCGARSYTRALHYGNEYAVARAGVRSLLAAYLGRDSHWFGSAHYGFQLSPEDQRRRFVLLALLQCAGLSRRAYSAQFGSDVLADLPRIADPEPLGLAIVTDDTIQLTETGLERSDAIGPWLYSCRVRRLMEESRCD